MYHTHFSNNRLIVSNVTFPKINTDITKPTIKLIKNYTDAVLSVVNGGTHETGKWY